VELIYAHWYTIVSDRYWYRIPAYLNYRGWKGNCALISDMPKLRRLVYDVTVAATWHQSFLWTWANEIPLPMLLLMDVDGRLVARRPVGWWEFCFNHPVVRCQILTYAVCCSPSLPYCSHIPPLPVLCIGMRPVRQRWWAWDWQPVLFSVRVDRISIWIFCFNQHILISIC